MARTVVVTGANGWIGGMVARKLLERGDQVIGVSRTPDAARETQPDIAWVGVEGDALDRAVMEAGLVVNCAGQHPFERPWDDAFKALVASSRIGMTTRVSAALGQSTVANKVLVNASGIWIHGESGEAIITEDTPASDATFLSRMHQDWESAAFDARHSGTRVVVIRIGLGLGLDGSALPFLSEPFRAGQGVVLGTGAQWIPWVHHEDLANLFVEALDNPAYEGVLFSAAPEPARYRALAEGIARSLGTQVVADVPVEQVQQMFGEGSEILLTSLRTSAAKVESLGFRYRYPALDGALADIFR